MSSEQYFDTIAGQWDEIRRSLFPDGLRDKVYAAAGLAPGQLVADLGAGSGFLTEGFLAHGVRVVAIDQSAGMLAELERRLAHLPGLETRRGEAERLPLADGAVDAVVANMFLHHVEDPAAAIREMARVLAPGGRLVITDLDAHDFEFLRREQHDRWLGFARADLARWLAEAGLVEAQVVDTADTCCSDSTCGDPAATVSVFLASATRPAAHTTGDDGEDLRRVVREHYGAAARQAASGARAGCGCGCSVEAEQTVSSDLYSLDELAGLPQEAIAASLGCANPVALAALAPGETVLDLGSGGGIDVLLSARRVGPTGKAYGVDMTEDMLALARRNQRQAGVENAEFLRGTIEQVPLPAEAVDVVISNCVVNLAGDKGRVLREAFRVLRPGGRLAIADIVSTRPMPPQLRQAVALWSACVGGALELEEYRRELTAAGFVDVDVEVTRRLEPDDLGPAADGLLAAAGLTPEEASGLVASALVRAKKPPAA